MDVADGAPWKTLLVVHDDSDRPGLLVDILNIFSADGINLKSIISRPTKKGLGNYNFFIDGEDQSFDPHPFFKNISSYGK